jgi:hypothetical protein
MKTATRSGPRPGLDRLLDSLTAYLTPAAARRLVAFRADADTQSRIEELAAKANEGDLTAEERHEYESVVRAIHLISVLQSKARIVLRKARKP